MGLFSRQKKPSPTIEAGGLKVIYDTESEAWEFSFEGVEFVSYGNDFKQPTREQIITILEGLKRLKPEMVRRLEAGWREYGNIPVSDGESFFVNISDLETTGEYEVCWSGGANWGDMGIDFLIKDHAIVDESWGD
jgi:hypothetical protein